MTKYVFLVRIIFCIISDGDDVKIIIILFKSILGRWSYQYLANFSVFFPKIGQYLLLTAS